MICLKIAFRGPDPIRVEELCLCQPHAVHRVLLATRADRHCRISNAPAWRGASKSPLVSDSEDPFDRTNHDWPHTRPRSPHRPRNSLYLYHTISHCPPTPSHPQGHCKATRHGDTASHWRTVERNSRITPAPTTHRRRLLSLGPRRAAGTTHEPHVSFRSQTKTLHGSYRTKIEITSTSFRCGCT